MNPLPLHHTIKNKIRQPKSMPSHQEISSGYVVPKLGSKKHKILLGHLVTVKKNKLSSAKYAAKRDIFYRGISNRQESMKFH
jgi:hypothetical protein